MWSKGISWINDVRIPFVDEKDPSKERYKYSSKGSETWGGTFGVFNSDNTDYNTQGRFPANLLVSDDMLNDGSVNGNNKVSSITATKNHNYGWGFKKITNIVVNYDKGTNSRYYDIDKWFDKLLEDIE